MAILTILSVSAYAQDSTSNNLKIKKHKTEKLKYVCPMHPDIMRKKPGHCSKCGMDLVKAGNKQMTEETKKIYFCPMKCEGDKTYDKPGKCPICGMALKEKEIQKTVYYCPMKCEGDKTYDKPGKCPVCGMSLREKIKQEIVYSCPMKCEGDKTYDKPGKCPVCGMNLTASPKKKTEAAKKYICPMHPDIVSDKPGKCSKCGMDLTEKKEDHSNHQ